jgi:hypothetical protein
MESAIKTWKSGRKIILEILNAHTPEQLNKIPDGFNNNLIWNIGHVIVVQQLVLYKRMGLDTLMPEYLIDLYRPGTKPGREISIAEIDELRELLNSLILVTEKDLENRQFPPYQPWTTRTGFHLASWEDAIAFNNFHEGLHLGYMLSIRKLV